MWIYNTCTLTLKQIHYCMAGTRTTHTWANTTATASGPRLLSPHIGYLSPVCLSVCLSLSPHLSLTRILYLCVYTHLHTYMHTYAHVHTHAWARIPPPSSHTHSSSLSLSPSLLLFLSSPLPPFLLIASTEFGDKEEVFLQNEAALRFNEIELHKRVRNLELSAVIQVCHELIRHDLCVTNS